MEITFDNQVALVTGSASGIGASAAKMFAESGAAVVVTDVDDRGAEVAKQLTDAGHKALFVKTDVSSETQVKAAIETAVSEFGSLDVAFNCAGYEGALGSVTSLSDDDFNAVLAVNLRGLWYCLKHELEQMQRQGRGAVVNCASVGGLVGVPGMPLYAATKHGVVGLTKTAALENATLGIRVNAICPGFIQTPMADRVTGGRPEVHEQLLAQQPNGRLGNPEEIASAAVWLASRQASLVTGAALAADGGWSAQ